MLSSPVFNLRCFNNLTFLYISALFHGKRLIISMISAGPGLIIVDSIDFYVT